MKSYQAALETGYEASALYYNLGNAHYKLNNVAPSIYYFEKALQLAPGDEEIQNNLKYAENLRVDVVEQLPENAVKKFVNRMVSIFSTKGWAVTTILFVSLFTLFFLLYYFALSTQKKRLYFTAFCVCALVAILAFGFSNYAFAKAKSDRPAIIYAQEVAVKAAPQLSSENAFTLHAGTKVQVLESIKNWKRIRLADGKLGWIPETELKEL
ncbi:SH3 domain-containing protein [Croceiramulus getboli]|nr:SH3 domain-containing protein [Flavobacteriaceae bacterium YJPT1-3]